VGRFATLRRVLLAWQALVKRVPFPFSRREVLLAGASASLVGCPKPKPAPDAGPPTVDAQSFDHATRVTFSPAQSSEDLTAFPQAVSSGAMDQSSISVMTRAAGPASVTLKVWRDVGSDTEVALVLEKAIDVPVHGNVKVRVDTLAPATWYRYAFFAPGLATRSMVGQFRTTFPDDWSEPVTLGTTSCAKLINAPFRALSLQAQQPMDFFLHLGDVSYNDTAQSLEDYRAMWRATLSDEGYRAVLPACGSYLVWDDHDFWNNFDIEAIGPSDARFLTAKETFLEALPVELTPEGHLWRSYRWGRSLELFILDCRTERKASTRLDADAQYLSRAQMDWLKAGLVASPCHFKVIANSVPISAVPASGWPNQPDRWQGFPAARDELLSHLTTNGLTNVWFLSGDFHLGLVMRVDASGPNSKYLEIAGGPAGNGNPLALLLEPGQEQNRKLAFPPEQFLFATGGYNATTLTFDPKADTVRAVFINSADGKTTYDGTLTFGVS
jgi:alkaline phosphatase D